MVARRGNEIFPSPRDTVSQSAPCFRLPSTESNSDTEYGSEFPISRHTDRQQMSFFFPPFFPPDTQLREGGLNPS